MTKKQNYLISAVIISLFMNCIIFFNAIPVIQNEWEINDEVLPKLSQSDINILTPENKTYKSRMIGYYPSIYGFESDTIGTLGANISWIEGGGTNEQNASIVGEIDGHLNVMKLEDSSKSDYIEVKHDVSVNYGSWEFWFRTNNVSENTQVIIRGDSYDFIIMGIENNQWYYEYASTNVPISSLPTPQDNTWYRITIHFRCDGESTPWQGLSQNRWKIEISGSSSIELIPTRTQSTIQQLKIKTEQGVQEQAYSVFIDAIGYSWDQNYAIGDNRNEGLLINFYTNSSFDWIKYSLDGQDNVTIIGNTTIPMPTCGYHTIQIFGNESSNMISSQLRRFKVEEAPISIDNSHPFKNWARAVMNYSWVLGSGTQNDPYIIENLIINGENSDNCISIANSNVSFIIRNCFVINSSSGGRDAGIKLYNVTNGLLIENNCSLNNRNGICLENSFYNNISRNTVNNNSFGGIVLYDSDNNLISDNNETIKGNSLFGVYLYTSHENEITNNNILFNQYAVYLYSSNFNRVWDNNFEGNNENIYEDGLCRDNILQSENIGNPFPIEIIMGVTITLILVTLMLGVGAILIKKDIITINFQSRKSKKVSSSTTQEVTPQDIISVEEEIKKEVIEPAKRDEIISVEEEIKKVTMTPSEIEPTTEPESNLDLTEPQPEVPTTSIEAEEKPAKKKKITEEKEKKLTPEEIEELKKTESEVDIEKKALTCIVHKGPIDGAIYVCPTCNTFYCTRCANALKKNNEKCWSCGSDISISLPDKTRPEKKRKMQQLELSLDSLRKTVQNLNDSFFTGAITKEEYAEMREPLLDKISTIMEQIEKLRE